MPNQPPPADSTQLRGARCVPCEGGIPRIEGDSAKRFAAAVPAWTLSDSHGSISRKLNLGNFQSAVDCLVRIGRLAEQEQHHPDLHLTGYRHLQVVLTTHAIGGLSHNDFILAAKIDALLEGDTKESRG
ncbi:MAG: 4a-hydroxytetrahydrobiopterin dehydratase [Planctomycetota bacterium]